LLLGGGGYFAYTQKWHEGVINFAGSFFGSKPAEKITVNYDENMLKSFGIFTANFFAVNTGSVNDIIPVQIRMADLFGYLKDPKVQGETGISAATFFGQLEDEAADINQFVVYMQFLEKLQNLFKTDVYAMLDRTSDRSRALLDYLDQLKVARDQGNDLLARIKISMDQFTVSYTSLSPDKTKYETDFFTAMAALESEKSDMLLKGFIDISQKQTALKSRVSALSKLIEYYDAALARLDKRITAVDQNLDALIAGIHVVDVPGAELNIIIKTVTTK
jgi:hypothetical protein